MTTKVKPTRHTTHRGHSDPKGSDRRARKNERRTDNRRAHDRFVPSPADRTDRRERDRRGQRS